jgi:hypothetical protein
MTNVMKEEKPGFIPLHRKFFDHEFWTEKREFSKAEAWIDLIQLARYDKSETVEFIDNKRITWGYGQLVGSVRFLKKRWNWKSNSKVERFLEILKKCFMIEIKTGQGINIITLCNFDTYDVRNNSNRTPTGQQQDSNRTPTGQNSNKGNKGNKGNNINLGECAREKNDYEPPDLKEVLTYAGVHAIPEKVAKEFYWHYDSSGWEDRYNRPIKNWTSLLNKWQSRQAQFNLPQRNGQQQQPDPDKIKAQLDRLEYD